MAVATSARMSFVNIIFGAMASIAFSIHPDFRRIQRGKPDPEIYLLAMSKLGMAPKDCFVLEDSSNGALAGKRAGAMRSRFHRNTPGNRISVLPIMSPAICSMQKRTLMR